MSNTFLCLLPCKEDSKKLQEYLQEVSRFTIPLSIKLPLHVTLFYFPQSTHKTNKEIMKWLTLRHSKPKGSLVIKTKGIGSFIKNGRNFVYYFTIASKKILDIHAEIQHMFSHIQADQFSFIPHISLFYPRRSLHQEEFQKVQKIFRRVSNISFDRIAFARENKGKINIISIYSL